MFHSESPSRQALAENYTVIDCSNKADHVDQTWQTMKSAEFLVQSHHLLWVGCRVVALLAITSFCKSLAASKWDEIAGPKHTLVLPLFHRPDSEWAQDDLIDQPRHCNSCERQECPKSTFRSEKSGNAIELATFAGSQGDNYGECGLKREVHREYRSLQRWELRTREHSESNNAPNKCLLRLWVNSVVDI